MAKIVEEIVVIKFSRLVKDDDNSETVVTDETIASLEAVAQELVGSGAIVEVEKA
jgi:hypothetical protein